MCSPSVSDDFKSGQTKMKSALVDFLINAGIKPTAITSYNHLGNNDVRFLSSRLLYSCLELIFTCQGKNLSEERQFRSKEISKSNVVDDMVAANPILYKVPFFSSATLSELFTRRFVEK